MDSRFLQIHTLTSYPAALLNRDDVGFAKRIPFGGAVRTRISSQCLKRHWRMHEGEHSLRSLGAPGTVRSRRTFEHYLFEPLRSEYGDAVAGAATAAVMQAVLGKSKKAASKKTKSEKAASAAEDASALRTEQITVLGRPEVEYLLSEARHVCQEADGDHEAVADAWKLRVKDRHFKKNLAALRTAAGLDGALFGRMVTSDLLARGDAAAHVAHALTVHEEQTESDYFSAVDDLQQESDDALGSAHIGSTELTSGLYYGYVVLDVPLLVSNLEGCRATSWKDADRELAASVAERLVHVVATVSPGAKLGATAPHARAHLVLLESGSAQPRSLANAFLRPVRARPDVIENTYRALGEHIADLDAMYGREGERRLSCCGPYDPLGDLGAERTSLGETAAWAAAQVLNA